MKTRMSLCALLVAAMMLLSLTVYAAPATTVNVVVNNVPLLEETGSNARVAWDQGVIEAMGTGVPAMAGPQGRALARRAAIVDAYRNLAEMTEGVQVDSETTMSNLMISSDLVKTRVSALIKGSKIIREKELPDGTYTVIVQMNMFGRDSLASVALQAIKPDKTEALPVPPAGYVPPIKNALYTGVIVDARGMDLQPTFSPRIYDETGTIIYGNKHLNIDFAISHGMVDYTLDDDMVKAALAGMSRAGDRPLVVKALRVTDNNCNVVISAADANAILSYNQSAGFLQKCAVVFEK